VTVNTTVDGMDARPGDGVCEMTVGAGDCSFRAMSDELGAEQALHHVNGDVQVHVESGTYTIDADLGPVATPDLPQLELIGEGHVVIDGSQGAEVGLNVDGGHMTMVGIDVHGGADFGIAVSAQSFVLASSTLTDNGTSVWTEPDTDVTLVDTTIEDSTAGGMYVGGTAHVVSSRFVDNGLPDGSGVGLESAGDTTFTDSTITGTRGIGAWLRSGSLTIDSSTIDHSSAATACDLFDSPRASCPPQFEVQGPGGILAQAGQLAIRNSTVADNAGQSGPAGLDVDVDAAASLEDSTLVGSPIDWVGGQPLSISGSVIGSCTAESEGSMALGTNNIAVGANGCEVPSTTVVGDAMLGSLADNGGATQTFLPASGSPVIDQVPVGTPGLCDGTIATDQRGTARPQGPACDVGSVEVVPTP
jgi:hypothetical protein